MRSPWWRDAVFYEIYVRSFADSDGDGVGDLPGLRSRLGYLRDLGVDALWLTPFYPSPQVDHGYDVADYRDVEPLFGTLGDFDALLGDAHALGLRVTIDIVPNHTSAAHPWFVAALAAGPGSRERDRYVFRAGTGRDGERPPNNWQSMFGGPAWTRVADGEWYLHLFDAGQPDLNWTNREVGDEFESILRFWLDRGVDGFRIDVANGLAKAEGLPDRRRGQPSPHWDQPGAHEVFRRWRTVLDAYPGDRMAVAEAWSEDAPTRALYTRPDEMHQAFNFHFQVNPWSAAAVRRSIDASLAADGAYGAASTWVLSSHDQPRHPTRYGGGEIGLARARAATLTMLALPGSSYLFQGEELGLEQVDVPPHLRQDPTWERSGRTDPGRDGCRVPIPWSGSAPPYGFGPGTGQPWLPQPTGWAALSAAAQDGSPGSTLEFYRAALRVRRDRLAARERPFAWLPSAPGTLAFQRGDLVCLTNFAPTPRRFAATGEVLVTSSPSATAIGEAQGYTVVPGSTAVWLAL
jgi:alpha-glucosidase